MQAMHRTVLLLLVGLAPGGCTDAGGIGTATARTATHATEPPARSAERDAERTGPGEARAAASAERDRARAVLRLELSRRLRARGQYHVRVAQGLGSAEVLAAMDAAIALLEERIEALEGPAPETGRAASGCGREPLSSVGGGPGRADDGAFAGTGCVGVVAACLPPTRCP